MSHLVSIRTQLRDQAAISAACQRLKLPEPVVGSATFYSGEAKGLVVRLPEWLYPVVIDLDRGDVLLDNYEGAWGDARQLDRLLQAYAVEKAKIEARHQGHTVSEQTLEDGSIKLSIHVG
jgi:hypothetical protein